MYICTGLIDKSHQLVVVVHFIVGVVCSRAHQRSLHLHNAEQEKNITASRSWYTYLLILHCVVVLCRLIDFVHTCGPIKMSPFYNCNNFVCCQPIFMLFGRHTLQKICNKAMYSVGSPRNMVCVIAVLCKILDQDFIHIYP